MAFDHAAIIHTPNNWLESCVTYSGQCVAEFTQPKGVIETSGAIRFYPSGEGILELDVPETATVDLDPAIPPPGDYRRHGHANPCVSLTVRTSNGEFAAKERITQIGASIGPGGHRIRLQPVHGQFVPTSTEKAAYWVLPLSNFVLDYWPRVQMYPPELAHHPLRIYPTPPIPEGLSEEDQMRATIVANQHNTLLTFKIKDRLGFIERLPSYARSVARLRSGRIGNAITAVMVGNTHVQTVDFKDGENLFPVDILKLLSLATGIRVGAPWIEFRDAKGKLVRRIHIRFGHAMFQQGCAGIEDIQRNATGHLLTRGMASPDCGKKYLRAAMNHAIAAATRMNSLESRFISVCRGFETLSKPHGLDTKERLTAGLNPIQEKAVKATLDETYDKIRAMMKADKDPARRRALERIADRARTAACKENDFGLAVVALARKFNFPDPDILETHYTANPRAISDSWPGILSHYRGAALHAGYFDTPDSHDHFEILQITDHLHDLLLRMILKTLEYDGPYLPPIPPNASRESVEWVTPTTPAGFLLGCYE